jgi:hypothetical protein
MEACQRQQQLIWRTAEFNLLDGVYNRIDYDDDLDLLDWEELATIPEEMDYDDAPDDLDSGEVAWIPDKQQSYGGRIHPNGPGSESPPVWRRLF